MCLCGVCPGWRPDQSPVAVQGVHSASLWLLRAQVLLRHSPLEWLLERAAVGATVALCLCLREHGCGCGPGLVCALGRWWQRAAAQEAPLAQLTSSHCSCPVRQEGAVDPLRQGPAL